MKVKFESTTAILLVALALVLLYAWSSCGKKEGFYHNNLNWAYTGCNPLLYSNCGSSGNCGTGATSCWREGEISDERDICPQYRSVKARY